MKISAPTATLGAVVTDVSLAELDDVSFKSIEDAWHRCGVLVFPGQHLTDQQQLGFTRRFGRLERGLKQSGGLARITNVSPDGTVTESGGLQSRFNSGSSSWHSGGSYRRVSPKASMMAAHQVPAEGGETEWADMRSAFDDLDEAMQKYLSKKAAIHSYTFAHASDGGLESLSSEELDRLPPVVHSLVRTDPETGRYSLFLGRNASHIMGEDIEETRSLLRDLTEDACRSPRLFKHRWEVGDIALWDNRCLLHRVHEWPLDQPRTMARSTVAGDAPDNEWALD